MWIRNLSLISTMTAISLSASPLLANERAEVSSYQYGTRLDIAKVITIEEPAPPACEIVRATMTFVNTQGETKQVSFLKQAQACLRD